MSPPVIGDGKRLAQTILSALATVLRYFPEENYVLPDFADTPLHYLDTATVRERARSATTSVTINALLFSPDSKTLASVNQTGKI